MIKRLMNQLEVLSVKLNHFMEEISKGEVLKGEAKGFVGESIIWTLREEYDKSKALWKECYDKYGESNINQ